MPPQRVFLLALAASILALLPVMAAHHLPLLDAPGHESRLAVLRDILTTGRGSAFYRIGTFFLPNIAFDVAGLGLIRFVEPETAGRIFFGATLVLTLWGILVLNRVAIGRWSATPVLSALLLYNLISILGFLSYAFGLALAPWALALRLKLERASPLIGFVVGTGFGIVLLFCHAFDFGIYAAMSAGFALVALIRVRIGFVAALLWVLELVPAVALYVAMTAGDAGRARYDPHFLMTKLFGIVKSVTSGSMTGDIAFVIGAASLALLLATGARPRLAASFIPGLIGLTALYLALPAKLGAGSYVDSRMPIAIAMFGLAGLDPQIRRGAWSAVLIALALVAFTVKQGALTVLWRSFDPQIGAIAQSLNALPAGAVIMQAECEPESGAVMSVYRERQPSMSHLAAMAGFDDTRFAASTWAIAGQHTVQVASAYQPYYDLQNSFGNSTCGAAGYHAELSRIQDLAAAEQAAGRAAPPLYFFLIRPSAPATLSADADLIANGADYELYAVRKP